MSITSHPFSRRNLFKGGIASAFALSAAAVRAQNSPQAGIKTIGVVAFNDALTSDIIAAVEVFGYAAKAGLSPTYAPAIIGLTGEAITTNEGLVIQPQFRLADAPPLDVIVMPSALNMRPVLDNDELIDFVKARAQAASWLCSNCSGVYVYAHAGLLRGKRVTTYPGGEIWLKAKHPLVRIEMGQTVVVDDKFITSNGAIVSYAAALELLSRLAGAAAAEKMRSAIYLDRLVGA